MTALGIRYLTGCAVSAHVAIAKRPEWPPHPGRVFMAMAAAHFETRGDDNERAALEWLEREPVPAIHASEAYHRSFVETFVPVNDKHGGIVKRGRQSRSFATARPIDDSVFLLWDSEPPDQLREGLERLCSKVTRIGHSSSLVQMWVERGGAANPNWIPGGNTERMRVAEPGTVAYLGEAFNQSNLEVYSNLMDALESSKGKEKAGIKSEIQERFPGGAPAFSRPKISKWQGYSRSQEIAAEQEPERGPFDPRLIVFTKNEGRSLGLDATLQLTSALRNAAMKSLSPGFVPEWLSGHQADGNPTLKPHVAFFPLPFVGADYADGHVMGLAMALPTELPFDGGTREVMLRNAIGPLLFNTETGTEKEIKLWRADAWEWQMSREKRERPPFTLRTQTWTGPSRVWASITPVVLHHYPKPGRVGDVERILREAFGSAQLPDPEAIFTRSVSMFEGAGHARSIPEFSEGGASLCRYQTHVLVHFSVPVEGPVLVGRGRFRGYGLFRPATERELRRGRG
jgi:CRISPR-associated protein Csb2